MDRITIEKPGHRYSIRHLDGDDETVVQFVQREPHHRPMSGILLQDLARIMIERLHVLNHERPHPFNAESIQDLRVFIARQEARALVEAVKDRKLTSIELLETGDNGHLCWDAR